MARDHSTAYFAPDSKAGARLRGSLVDALQQYRTAVQESALRSAVHAGAIVLYEELQRRTPVDEGTLSGAIYRWHDDRKSVDGRQVYAVGVNKGKAPHWFNVEYGHVRVNAGFYQGGKWVPLKTRLAEPEWVMPKPYLRPTWDAKGAEAVQAMQAKLRENLRELANAGPQPSTEAIAL